MSAPDGDDPEAGGQQIGKKLSFREGAISFGHYALAKYLAARWAKCFNFSCNMAVLCRTHCKMT